MKTTVKTHVNHGYRLLAIISLILGVVLLGINLYGLNQPLRMPGLGLVDHEQLRFIPTEVWEFEQSMMAIEELSAEKSKQHLAEKANAVVNQSLVHVEWEGVDPVAYRQLVPVWENYFLYVVGRFSGLEQFERYHYSDYERNIRRGIGICGDASTVLSSILNRFDIANRIISFPGHVIVEFTDASGTSKLLDPDFGVLLGVNLEQLIANPGLVRTRYLNAGYSPREVGQLIRVYQREYKIFDGTYHFMSKRYIFEYASYIAKWLLPLLLLAGSIVVLYQWRCQSRDPLV